MDLIAQQTFDEKLDYSKHLNRDSLGRTLVHHSCIFGNILLLQFLVENYGPELLIEMDDHQVSATHIAARNGYLEILKFLKSHNAIQLHKESRFNTSPLDLTIAFKHLDCFDFLLSYIQPALHQQVLNDALITSSQEGNLECVKKLIEAGADLTHRMANIDATPLDRAAYNGHTAVAEYLLNKGALINSTRKDGITPLFVACSNGHFEVAQLLIARGAEVFFSFSKLFHCVDSWSIFRSITQIPPKRHHFLCLLSLDR